MWLSSILHSLSPNSPRTRTRCRPALHQRPAACRLTLEALEDRTVPSGMVSLAPSVAAPQLVGEGITWTATAIDCGAAPLYQFSVAPHAGAFRVVRAFSPANAFAWTPMQEGDYDIQVTVKDGYQATETASAVAADVVASRVTGSQAFITPTLNPLVALYSAPPTSAQTMFVQFSVAADSPSWRNTNTVAVVPGKSTNFFVAGMLPSTTYQMRHVLSDGTGSAPQLFTTGALASTLMFQSFTVQQPPAPGSDLSEDIIFHQFTRSASTVPNPVATDLQGQVVWYYDVSQSGLSITFPGQSLVSGGTVLLIATAPGAPFPTSRNILREIDLAGNSLRETNLNAVNAQLTAMGHEIIYSFNHDVQRLPNGTTAVIGLTERTVNINGTPTDYVGNMIIVLDENLQVTWAWDAFDHLDVNRGPVLGEILLVGSAQPTASVPRLPAVDWLHLNAVSWSPADSNLILSIRHQDWVTKIDYRNGAGDGNIIWRLGQGGDFTVDATDPSPWFSHQHNAHYIDDSSLLLFDNGNTRRASDPNAHSRGQVWQLDEQTMTATLVVNADLGGYAGALGAAQQLSNGNFSFTLGTPGAEPPVPPAHTIEVTPNGARLLDLQVNRPEYRSFRMRTLYEGANDALAGAPQRVDSVVLNDGAAQRSMVNSLTVTFNGAAILDPGAIELRGQDGSLVDLHADISILGGKTVAVLTFAGTEFIGGSLADGSYTLTIRADRVHDQWGRELDGDADSTSGGNRVDAFFRLYGDSDGDRDVDVRDLRSFLGTFGRSRGDPDYLASMDFNGDDRVGLIDLLVFVHRLGTHLNP